jgi:hypothetical protein
MRPLLRQLAEPILLAENHSRGQQCAQTDNPLQPKEWRRIEPGNANPTHYDIGEHPERDKDQNKTKITRPRSQSAYAFEDAL